MKRWLSSTRNSGSDFEREDMKSSSPPWKKSAPKKSRHTKLSAQSRQSAKAAAKRAGRKYPNLVDNMKAAKKQRARKER